MEAAATSNTILEIKELKTYFFLEKGTVKAVDGVNLKLDRKTTLGVVGESGCGKSVTARSVMRIIKSPPGKIVDGQILLHRRGNGSNGSSEQIDLTRLDPKGRQIREIRGAEISMIFQEPMTSLKTLLARSTPALPLKILLANP